METKFTNWRIEEQDKNGQSLIIDEYYTIATVYGGLGEQSFKNSKLIVSAPTMYEKHEENDVLCGKLVDLLINNSLALDLLIKIKHNCCTAIQKATE